ncbi:hypothetical protein AAE478_008988 [Parahypoxylon ruwenzoriense]
MAYNIRFDFFELQELEHADQEMKMETVLRNACDACHKLKTKCSSDRAEPIGRVEFLRYWIVFIQIGEKSDKPHVTISRDSTKHPQGTNLDPIAQQNLLNATDEQSTMNNYLSALHGALARSPAQTDLFIPDTLMLDSSWHYQAPPSHHDAFIMPTPPDSYADTTSSKSSAESLNFIRRNGGMNFNTDTSHGINVGITGAMKGTKRWLQESVDSLGPSPGTASPDFLINTYSQLANILFALRTSQGKTSPEAPNSTRKTLEETFPLVSSFCDIIKKPNVRGLFSSEDDAISPCLLLAGLVISTVVEVYHARIDLFDRTSCHDDAVEFRTQHYLELHSDATTMDFHLAQLQKVFNETQLRIHDAHTIGVLEKMRGIFRTFIGDWRRCIEGRG